jgi:SAM-dependent methyltransferase
MFTSNYGRLSTEFYDIEKGFADASEVDFFAPFLGREPALEAMCGSGRLLIPLLRRGLRAEGVDNSPAMLEKLQWRCERLRLPPPPTHLQSITELNLARRYATIFIALGSFQLIAREQALNALSCLRDHLETEGTLVIDTFVPWDLIQLPDPTRLTKSTVRSGNRLIHRISSMQIEVSQQRYRIQNHYERQEEDRILEQEGEDLCVQWYFPEEFLELLREAGFSAECHSVPFGSFQPRRFIYEAKAAKSSKE